MNNTITAAVAPIRTSIPATSVAFRGRDLLIAVRDPHQVLEPTGVGLSLLVAIEDPGVLPIAGRSVLDVGCGSGLYTVTMVAAGASRVTGLDINPDAHAATLANLALNDLPARLVEQVTCDIATFVPAQRFQIVLANPPHFPDADQLPAGGLHAALVGGNDGRAVYDALVESADRLLTDDGVLVLAHSSLTDIGRTKAEMSRRGFTCTTARIVSLPIPFAALEEHRPAVMARLAELRAAGRADFDTAGRLTVHTLLFTREGARA